MHMGSLHAYEQALTLVLAFGPFLVLGLVVVAAAPLGRREPPTPAQARRAAR